MSTGRASGAIEAVERIINREEEADEILRQTVRALADRLDVPVAVRFHDEEQWVVGPSAGGYAERGDGEEVRYRGDVVADLAAGAGLDADGRAAFVRVALLISPYCLVGWDIGGEDWEP
jgi:hypothetical protein